GGPAYLFRNDSTDHNRALRVRLEGTRSNRDGIGAVVTIENGAERQWQMMHSGSSYLSQSELVLTFGLAQRTSAATLQVDWPSGQTDKLPNVQADQAITIQEGKGIIVSRKFSSSAAPPLRSAQAHHHR